MSFLTTPEGVRLRFTDRGEGEHTIVLVHGWKGSHRMWDPAVYRLMREFRVIAFDNRGMGESDKPGGPYDFAVLADDLGFVLETLEAGDVTLVGWSMGCTISLEYLARGGGRVGRLVLMNGPLKLTKTPEFPWTMSDEQLSGYLDGLAAGLAGCRGGLQPRRTARPGLRLRRPLLPGRAANTARARDADRRRAGEDRPHTGAADPAAAGARRLRSLRPVLSRSRLPSS